MSEQIVVSTDDAFDKVAGLMGVDPRTLVKTD